MKVKIGPYRNWLRSRIHERHMDKKYGMFDKWPDDTEDWTPYERFLEKLEDTLQSIYNATINKLANKFDRTIKVRIDPWDTWNMDNTLAHIILPMLKQLKKSKKGAPWVDDEDVPNYLRSTNAAPKENEYDTDEFHFKRWDWALRRMIWSFEQILDEDGGHQFYYDPYLPDEKIDKSIISDYLNEDFIRKMGKYNPDKYKKYNERVQIGLILFGKYFRNLWD